MVSANRTGHVHYRTADVGGVNVFYREDGPGRRARRAPAARLPFVFAHVPRPDPPALGRLPRHRPGLSRVRPQRRAGPVRVRLHLRPPGRRGRRPARAARNRQVRDLRDGLRRGGRIPARAAASRTAVRDHRAERAAATPGSRRAGGPPWASTGRTGPPSTATPRAPTWTGTGCAASTCPASRTPRGSTRTTGSSTRR